MTSAPAPAAAPRRLRVLQCITRLGLGGAERVAFSIIRALRAEIDFAVFTVHGSDGAAVGLALERELAAAGVPWFRGTRVPMKAGGMIPGGLALARAVRAFRPDLVHFHSETPETCGAAWLALRPPAAPVALARTIHNSIFWRYWPRIGRWCDRRLAAAAVNAVSSAAAAEFDRYRRDRGAPPPADSVAVVYNGVDLPARPPAGAPRRPGLRRVIFAGRFEPQKGTDVLCAALAAVRLPDATRGELVFVGDGAQSDQVDALVRRGPAPWTVRRQAPVADLPGLLTEFDLLVMPSRFEGLGLVAVEATLCGLPLVATDAPGLREALPADYPWRCPPADTAGLAAALTTALAATDRWAPVVQSAQRFAAERFGPARMAAGYRAFFARARPAPAGVIASA